MAGTARVVFAIMTMALLTFGSAGIAAASSEPAANPTPVVQQVDKPRNLRDLLRITNPLRFAHLVRLGVSNGKITSQQATSLFREWRSLHRR